MEDISSYWEFIESYYPNYYSSNEILLSDILYRKLNGEEIFETDEKMIKDWDIRIESSNLDKEILEKALKNYFTLPY